MGESFEPARQAIAAVGDFSEGVVEAFSQPVNGIRQLAGQEVDPHQGTGSGAEMAGQIAGNAVLLIGGTMLAKRIPGLGTVVEGRLAPLAVGGTMGFLAPVRSDQGVADRLLHGGTAAAAMAISDLGRGSLKNVVLANGAAGAFHAEASSLIDTGNHATSKDLLLSAGLWAGTGAVFHGVGSYSNFKAEQAEARRLTEMRPWQFKDVRSIDASELRAGQSLEPGHYNVSFQSQGHARSFDLYVSEQAALARGDAPVVTFLHGLNPKGESQKIIRELSFNKFADEDGAVVAYLHGKDGLRGPLTGDVQSWNDTKFGFTKADPSYSDRVAFTDMMRIIDRHVPQANTDSIAVTGFSLGGKMANRIAATNDSVVSLGTIHGTTDAVDHSFMSGLGRSTRRVDATFVLGTNDRVLPINGGRGLFTALLDGAGAQRPRSQAEFWVARNGGTLDQPLTVREGTYTRSDWTGPSGRVTEYTVHGGEHAIHGTHAKKNLIQWLMGEPKPPEYFDARQRTWDAAIKSIRRNITEQQETRPLHSVSI